MTHERGGPDPRYCVWSKFANAYVRCITITDTGVKLEYTKFEANAARVAERWAADAMVALSIHGKVREHSGAKPSTLEEIQDRETL